MPVLRWKGKGNRLWQGPLPLSRFPERIQLRIAVNNSLAKVQLLLPQRTRPSIKGVFWKEDLHSYLSVTAPLETLSVFPYWLLLLSTSRKCRSFAPDSPFPPGGGNGNPLQYSCWGNPMDRGAWRATVHGVAESQSRLRDWEHCSQPLTSSAGASLKRPQSGWVIPPHSPRGHGAFPVLNSMCEEGSLYWAGRV